MQRYLPGKAEMLLGLEGCASGAERHALLFGHTSVRVYLQCPHNRALLV